MSLMESLNLAPLELLDVMALTVLIFSYAIFLASFSKFFKNNESLRRFGISSILGVAPAILFTLIFSYWYDEVTMFLISYPSCISLFWTIYPWVQDLLNDVATHTHQHTLSQTQEANSQDSDSEEEA